MIYGTSKPACMFIMTYETKYMVTIIIVYFLQQSLFFFSSLKHIGYFANLSAHVIFKLIILKVFDLLSAVEGLEEAASTRAYKMISISKLNVLW